jgi:hypothetical protein
MIPSMTLETVLSVRTIFTSYRYLPAAIFVVVAAFIESATLPAAEFAIVTVRFAVTFAE